MAVNVFIYYLNDDSNAFNSKTKPPFDIALKIARYISDI